MKKKIFTALALLLLLTVGSATAQTTQWGVPTGNARQFPKGEYRELPDPKPTDAAKWQAVRGVQIKWGTTDVRYSKAEVPVEVKKSDKELIKGWRGERVAAQALVYSAEQLDNLNFEISPLKGKGGEIAASAAFVRYVMSDNFLKCGFRGTSAKYDSLLIPDPIDHLAKSLPLDAMTVRPVWVSVWIPRDAAPGDYSGVLTVKNENNIIGKLTLNLNVIDRTLPKPEDFAFHLDFWQNPFAEARYEEVVPFSAEHFNRMRPALERLRDAGQKVITTSIMHKPWGGQTEDYFESMITWTKKANGTWDFDFTIFDMWVEYMMEIGIDKQIACYSMIPWEMSFKYYDQISNSMKELVTTTDSPEYREVWTSLLKQLAAHLKEKGWFSRTCIAMDERDTKDMQNAFKIIWDADPEYKVSLAGGVHPELEEQLYDYSMVTKEFFTPEVLAKRKAAGKVTTYYTCCGQQYPNMFAFTAPAETEWIAWFASSWGYDGYLRWAYNSYTKEPLLDARFRAFQAGDSYLIYPENRTCIRFEKFVDGVESFEKARLLREEFTAKGDKKSLAKLDEIMAAFRMENFEKGIDPRTTLEKSREAINSL